MFPRFEWRGYECVLVMEVYRSLVVPRDGGVMVPIPEGMGGKSALPMFFAWL